jgi:hypothetical protein
MRKNNMKDKKYVAERDKLIPFAVRYTDKKHGPTANGNHEQWTKDWTGTFMDKMNSLARENGLFK